jgi:hypothetical protein
MNAIPDAMTTRRLERDPKSVFDSCFRIVSAIMDGDPGM